MWRYSKRNRGLGGGNGAMAVILGVKKAVV